MQKNRNDMMRAAIKTTGRAACKWFREILGAQRAVLRESSEQTYGGREGKRVHAKGACRGGSTPPLVAKMVQMCEEQLGSSGRARDMAGRVLGRLLTRPDTRPAFSQFLDWARAALRDSQPSAAFLVPGTALPSFPTLVGTIDMAVWLRFCRQSLL